MVADQPGEPLVVLDEFAGAPEVRALQRYRIRTVAAPVDPDRGAERTAGKDSGRPCLYGGLHGGVLSFLSGASRATASRDLYAGHGEGALSRTRRRSGGVAGDRVRDSADPRPHGFGAGAAFRSRRPRLW